MSKDYCKGCVYRTYAGAEPICGYILVERHRRPCPPGEGCTAKVVGGKNTKMKRIKTFVMFMLMLSMFSCTDINKQLEEMIPADSRGVVRIDVKSVI